MAAANSLNISQQGVVYFNGVAQFSGLDGGLTGQVLTSNGTGVAPTFQTPGVNGLLIMKSTNVNLKNTGATTLFTTNSGHFIIIGITTYAVSLSGVIASATANFGWTAANYDDIVNGYTSFPVSATGNYIANMSITGSEVAVVPPSTAFKINVTSEDSTATTNTQRIDVIGYYL